MRVSRKACWIGVAVGIALLAIWEWVLSPLDRTPGKMLGMTVTRLVGAGIFLIFLLYLEYRVLHRKKPDRITGISLVLCFLVCLNNWPWIGLMSRTVRVTGTPGQLLLLAAECLCVGLFEEITFRGVLFLRILENRRSSVRQIFLCTVVSSALFGLIHLVNLFEGAGIGSVLLQIGYSFLIGGMCAILLLRTGNLLVCIFLHALFDFGGTLITTLGEGELWDLPTVILTAVLGVLVTAWMVFALRKVSPEDLDRFYGEKAKIDNPREK